MEKTALTIYKFPMILSVTLAITVISLSVISDPLLVTQVILGSLVGTFFLDIEYLIFAYISEPHSVFARDLKSYIKHQDYRNALSYIYYHHNDVEDKSLNSFAFQMVLIIIAVITTTTTTNLFVKTFVLSVLLNSIYKLVESYFDHSYKQWFWIVKNKPSRKGVLLYCGVITTVFLYLVTIIR